jgi:hypothetical protein
MEFAGVFVLLIISIKPLHAGLKKIFAKIDKQFMKPLATDL